MDKVLAGVISDLLINLTAGWLGAAVIVPINIKRAQKIRPVVLTINLFLATVSLLFAYYLRQL